MEKIQQLNILRRTIVTRAQRLSVRSSENHEPMVKADKYDPEIMIKPVMGDMQPVTGSGIYVRDTVAAMLSQASGILRPAGYYLIIGYGYRTLDIQQKYWEASKKMVREKYPGWTEEEIACEADKYTADPEVAGHITGGCVDVSIGPGEGPEKMGAALGDITADAEKIKTFGENLTGEQISNRMVLFQAMTQAGFMPFFGEYWHFMYGDREWAYFSGLDESLYSDIDFRPR
jgi:D-alanyl-D-alanine dipeptidase